MNDIVEHEPHDLINTVVNPNWNKASTSWMVVGFTSIVYAVVNPCVEVLFGAGILFVLLSFIAYKAGKKNNGGKLDGKRNTNRKAEVKGAR